MFDARGESGIFGDVFVRADGIGGAFAARARDHLAAVEELRHVMERCLAGLSLAGGLHGCAVEQLVAADDRRMTGGALSTRSARVCG